MFAIGDTRCNGLMMTCHETCRSCARMYLFVDLWGQRRGVRDEGCKVPRSSERVRNNAISSRGLFFLKSALRLMTNILYALIMYMYMYGFLNAFKIKLLEILLIK